MVGTSGSLYNLPHQACARNPLLAGYLYNHYVANILIYIILHKLDLHYECYNFVCCSFSLLSALANKLL